MDVADVRLKEDSCLKAIDIDLRLTPSPIPVTNLEDAQSVVEDLVDQIKRKVHGHCGMRVNQIIQAGSLGMGTTLNNRFKSDLIIYSPDVDVKEVERMGYQYWLSKLNNMFQSDDEMSKFYKFQRMTGKALQCSFEGVDMDVLVSPQWGRPGELYNFFETIKPQLRNKFMHSAAKWQVQFFRQQPTNQKKDFRREFIRRAKAWREQKWPLCTGGTGRPSSYLLSLLVIKAYENSQKRMGVFSSLSPESLAYLTTEEMKSMIYNHKKIDVYWEQCYSLRQYPTLIPPSPPRIMDPANPANNLYVTGVGRYGPYERRGEYEVGDGDWTSLQRVIGTLDLSKPVEHWV